MDDLISRQAAIYNLANIAKNCAKSDKQKALMGRCIYMTENMPSVQPEQKTGQWGLAIRYDPKRKFVCDQCVRMAYEQSKYCPNCGAKMRDGE